MLRSYKTRCTLHKYPKLFLDFSPIHRSEPVQQGEPDSFVLIHNHPSGKAEPSESDNEVIQKLKEKAETMEMSFLDFIIVGDKNYWSMFEEADGGEYGVGAVE